MTQILIAYGTDEGTTGHVADAIRGRGHHVDTRDLKADAPNLAGYGGIIVGASIHLGKHEGYVVDFARRNRALLERLPSAFFSVSMAAQDNPGGPEVKGYVDALIVATGWRPHQIGVFAGALLHTKYDFIIRWIMKRIARTKGNRGIDTSRDYLYTDFDAVRRFGEAFAATLGQAELQLAATTGAVAQGGSPD